MLEIKNISKEYTTNGRQTSTLKDISFAVEDTEFVALVGPSGCGKTTFLKIIAGLVEATSGEIMLNSEKIIHAGKDRGMVFQNFSLFPWLTVRENIGFGLEFSLIHGAEKNKIIARYLRVTGLTEFADFYAKDLSGGMQQRVAIARTLASNPKVLLMDEPFGSLDAQTRSLMQEFLLNMWEKDHKTIVFVTHDVQEAIFLADRVYVLSGRPTKIKKVFTIPFARSREHVIKHTPEFFALAAQISKELES